MSKFKQEAFKRDTTSIFQKKNIGIHYESLLFILLPQVSLKKVEMFISLELIRIILLKDFSVSESLEVIRMLERFALGLEK